MGLLRGCFQCGVFVPYIILEFRQNAYIRAIIAILNQIIVVVYSPADAYETAAKQLNLDDKSTTDYACEITFSA